MYATRIFKRVCAVAISFSAAVLVSTAWADGACGVGGNAPCPADTVEVNGTCGAVCAGNLGGGWSGGGTGTGTTPTGGTGIIGMGLIPKLPTSQQITAHLLAICVGKTEGCVDYGQRIIAECMMLTSGLVINCGLQGHNASNGCEAGTAPKCGY